MAKFSATVEVVLDVDSDEDAQAVITRMNALLDPELGDRNLYFFLSRMDAEEDYTSDDEPDINENCDDCGDQLLTGTFYGTESGRVVCPTCWNRGGYA